MSGHLDINPVFATQSLCGPPKLNKDSMSWGGRRLIWEVRRGWISPLGLGIQAWRGLGPLGQLRRWEEPGPPCAVTGTGVEAEVIWWARLGGWA